MRKAKEKTRPTEMRAQMNKRAFAHTLGGEYGDDSMGLDFGLLGKEGGNLRATQKKEKQAKNPPIFRKVFGSVEQEALEAFAAKKKLEEQRYELKTFIQFSHGHKAWDELIAMEGKIRKARQEQLYRKQEFKDRCIEGLFILFLLCTIIGFGWLVWYLKSIQE